MMVVGHVGRVYSAPTAAVVADRCAAACPSQLASGAIAVRRSPSGTRGASSRASQPSLVTALCSDPGPFPTPAWPSASPRSMILIFGLQGF